MYAVNGWIQRQQSEALCCRKPLNRVFSGRKQKRTKSKNHSGTNSAVSDVWTTLYKSNMLDEKKLLLCPGTAGPRQQPHLSMALLEQLC